MRRKTWMVGIVAAGIGCFGLTDGMAQTAYHINFTDGAGVVDAISRGDYDALAALSQRPDINQNKSALLAIQASEARIRGNLTQSTQIAKGCYDPATLSSGHSANLVCGLLIAGNALNEGDIATWAKLTLEMKAKSKVMFDKDLREGMAKTQQANGKPIDVNALLANYDVDVFTLVSNVEGFQNWPFLTRVESLPSSPSTLALMWNFTDPVKKKNELPFVKVTVNGKSVAALVDTGSSVAVAVNPNDAQTLGIAHVTPGWIKLNHLGTMETASLGNAGSLSLGDARFENVPVVVSSGAAVPVIGLNLLRQLGSVEISHSQLTIHPHLPDSCATPLAMNSAISGPINYLVYPITLDGQPHEAFFDTGMAMPFYAMSKDFEALANTPGAQTKVISFMMNGEPRMTPYVDRKGQLVLGGQTLSIGYPTFDGKNMAFGYAIASHITAHFDFYADFQQGHSCFRPAKRPPSD